MTGVTIMGHTKTKTFADPFQYPEGFWPDSDSFAKNEDGKQVMGVTIMGFQYPEGFWPDSDGQHHYIRKQYTPVSTHYVSVPRRVLAR